MFHLNSTYLRLLLVSSCWLLPILTVLALSNECKEHATSHFQSFPPSIVENLWKGVERITFPKRGSSINLSNDAIPIVSSANRPSNFIGYTHYGDGQVLALGYEGLVTNQFIHLGGNKQFFKNVLTTFKTPSNGIKLVISEAHDATIQKASLAIFLNVAKQNGFLIDRTTSSLTQNDFAGTSVLFIGNALSAYSSTEIELIKTFVESGGGLILAGNGTAWAAANLSRAYPMNQLGEVFGFNWTAQSITEDAVGNEANYLHYYIDHLSFISSLADAIETEEEEDDNAIKLLPDPVEAFTEPVSTGDQGIFSGAQGPPTSPQGVLTGTQGTTGAEGPQGNDTQDATIARFSLSVISYELASTYKLQADEFFIQEDTLNAKIYYDKANNLLADPTKFNQDKFYDSYYFTGTKFENASNNPGRELCVKYHALLVNDIKYRLQLLTAGIDFWGLAFTNQILLPADRFDKWQTSVRQLQTTYEKFKKLYAEKKKLEGQDEAIRKKQLNDTYGLLQNRKEKEKAAVVQTTYQNQTKNYESRRDLIMQQQQALNQQSKSLANELEATEEAVLDNAADLISTSFGVPPLSGGAELFAGGELKIQNLLPVANQMIGTLGPITEFIDNNEGWIKVITDNKDKLKELLKNPSDEAFMAAAQGMFPDNEEIQIITAYYETGDKIVKLAENANRCFDEFSYDCLSDNVNSVINTFPIDEDLKASWELLDSKAQRIDFDKLATDVTTLLEEGDMRKMLCLGDNLSRLDPVFQAQWEKSRRLMDQAAATIKDGSFKELKNLGELIVKEGIVSEEDLQKIKEEIEKLNKPVGILLDYAFAPNSPVYSEAVCIACNHSQMISASTQLDTSNFLAAMNATIDNAEFQGMLYQELIIAFPDRFIGLLDRQQEQTLATFFEVATLSTTNMKKDKIYHLYKNGSTYELGGAILPSLEKIKSRVNLDYVTNKNRSLKGFTELVLMNKAVLQEEVTKTYKTAEIVAMLGAEQQAAFYDELYTSMDGAFQAAYLDSAAYIQLGRHAFYGNGKGYKGMANARATTEKQIETMVHQVKNTHDKAVKEQLVRQALKMGLNSAFPGVGSIVDAGISVLASLTKASNLIDQMNDIVQQQKENRQELLRIDDQLIEFKLKSSIAEIEQEQAKLSIDLAAFEHQYGNLYLDKIGEETTAIRRDIINLMRLFFFQSEVVRKNWYLLNKSTKFWHNQTVTQIIVNNPNNTRLAIDPDIRLFEWLNLGSEGQRTNLGKINDQWSGVLTVLEDEDNVDLLIYGSDNNVALEQYSNINVLESLSPETLADFHTWQAADNNDQPFTFTFNIDRTTTYKPFVDARIACVLFANETVDGKLEPLSDVEIRIDAPYSVLRENSIEEEVLTLSPIGTSTLFPENTASFSFRDAQDYRNGWGDKDRKPAPLEGVGLFSEIKFTIHKNKQLRSYENLHNIIMTIKFQHNPSKVFNPALENEPAYYSLEIAHSENKYDKTIFTPADVKTMGKSILSIESKLKAEKGAQSTVGQEATSVLFHDFEIKAPKDIKEIIELN